jgi:hypothetical protein
MTKALMEAITYRLWKAMSCDGFVEIETLSPRERWIAGRMVRSKLAHVQIGRLVQGAAAGRIDNWEELR